MNNMRVIKRNGEKVNFDINRIRMAISKAFNSLNIEYNNGVIEHILITIDDKISELNKNEITIDEIQSIVIDTLLELGYYNVAKEYIEYKKERDIIRNKRLEEYGIIDDWKMRDFPFYVMYERYLLRDDKNNVIETPKQLLKRVARFVAIPEIIYSNEDIIKIEDGYYVYADYLMDINELRYGSPPLENKFSLNGFVDYNEFSDDIDNIEDINSYIKENIVGRKKNNIFDYPEVDMIFYNSSEEKLIRDLLNCLNNKEYSNREFGIKPMNDKLEYAYVISDVCEKLKNELGLNYEEIIGLMRAYYYYVYDKIYVYGEDIERDYIYSFFGFVMQLNRDRMKEYYKYVNIFYGMMKDRKFLPNSPTLFNAGTKYPFLFACNTIPIYDSIRGIYKTLELQALLFKYGGGVGINFSNLRPKDSLISSSKGKSSGAISFMELFNLNTEVIKQGGKRRGANMGILKYNHPEIFDFINAKTELNKLNNFNISVLVDNYFWKALKDDEYIYLEHEKSGKIRKVKVKDIYDNIVRNAWNNGEPAMLFEDNFNSNNPFRDILGDMEITNPCSEQIMYYFESCNLGSLNLSKFVDENGKFMFNEYSRYIEYGIRFLDNVIDMSIHLTPEFLNNVRRLRRVGLGIMGYADMLIKMGLIYGNKNALKITEQIAKELKDSSNIASEKLSKERGEYNLYRLLEKENDNRINSIPKRRNGFLLSIAPTGTLSIFAQTSSSIEPIFFLVYERRLGTGKTFIDSYPLFDEYLKRYVKDNKEIARIKNEIISNDGRLTDDIKRKYPELRYFITSLEIGVKEHLNVMRIFAKYIDAGISKTINLPFEASLDDVKDVFKEAHDFGAKGITIYRTGSREGVINPIKKDKNKFRNIENNLEKKDIYIYEKNKDKDETNVIMQDKKPVLYGSDDGICHHCSVDIDGSEVKKMFFKVKP